MKYSLTYTNPKKYKLSQTDSDDWWITYWTITYISLLTAQATSATEYTITATIIGTGQDGMSVEYSDDMGVTWNIKGTTTGGTYNATGMTSGILYQWRTRLYRGIHYGDYVDAINYLQTGIDESCITFSGSNYFRFVRDKDHNFKATGGLDQEFWISAWVYITSTDYVRILDRTFEYNIESLGSNLYFTLYSEGAATPYLGIRTFNNEVSSILNGWHHLLFTYDGSKIIGGMKIYIDNNSKPITDASSGIYVEMGEHATAMSVSMLSGDRMFDFRIGSGILTAGEIASLYLHGIIAKEITYLPISEGYGIYLHNVISNIKFRINATIIGGGTPWTNTQNLFKYNYNYGCTKIDDYIFPNLSTKQKYFSPIYGIIQAGQSNASSDYGQTALLAGGDYDSMTDSDSELMKTLNYIAATFDMREMSNLLVYNAFFGITEILGFLHNQNSRDFFVVRHALGTTGLYPGSSPQDWHPDTVGELYDILNGYIQTRLNLIFLNGREPFIKSFVWIHGEQDSANPVWANAYQDSLIAFFNAWKTDLCSELNIQISELGPAYAGANPDIIRTKQALFAASYGSVYLHQMDGATTVDGQHYDAATIVDLAERIYSQIDDIEPSQSNSYLNKLIPTFNKLYYTAHP